MKIYRHGDVSLHSTEKKEGLKKVAEGNFILAYGETTGHKHVIVADREATLEIYQDNEGRHYLDLRGGNATITHEEHKKITITPGFYIKEIEQEFDYSLESIKAVED